MWLLSFKYLSLSRQHALQCNAWADRDHGTVCLSSKLHVELVSHTKNCRCVSSGGVSSQHPRAHTKLQGRTASPVLAETEQTPELCSAGSALRIIIFTGKKGQLARTQLSNWNLSDCTVPRGYGCVELGWCWLGCFWIDAPGFRRWSKKEQLWWVKSSVWSALDKWKCKLLEVIHYHPWLVWLLSVSSLGALQKPKLCLHSSVPPWQSPCPFGN